LYFTLQKSAIDQIKAEIKTPTGKPSLASEIKHLYIIHRLNYYRTFRKDDYARGVPFSSTVLTDKFGNSSNVKQVMRYLINAKFIIKVKGHQQRTNCSQYQLHPSIENELVYKIEFTGDDSSLIRQLEARAQDIKYHDKQLSILKNYVCLNEAGIMYLKSKYGSLPMSYGQLGVEHQDRGLADIYYKQFYAVRPDLKSRVYTNLASLSREHRKYIKFNGQPMLMTDISNSQILLTVPLLRRHWARYSGYGYFNIPEDVKQFQKLAESGKFYEHIAEAVNIIFQNDNERGKFKQKVFAEIWFSKNSRRNTAIKKVFRNNFPTVYDIIWAFKEPRNNETDELTKIRPHRRFAIELQRFEASIVVDKVWKKMTKMGKKVLTLHDAIICNNEGDLLLAEQLLESEMFLHSITPKFKREKAFQEQKFSA
jgi:hypothetical protein